MGAAPLLVDDPVFSPELALVDAELSASLRARLPDVREEGTAAPSARTAEPLPEQADDLEVATVSSVIDDSPEPTVPVPVVAVVDDLPDYVIAPTDEAAPSVDVARDLVAGPSLAPELATAGEPQADDVVRERVEEYTLAADEATVPMAGSFPALPSLEVRQEALDETDAALRKIRDQLGSGETARRRPRVRRRFIVFSGFSAVAALAALAADSYSNGSVALPSGWLGF